MRKAALLIICLLFPFIIYAQSTGELKGQITEEDKITSVPFANVILEQNGVMIIGQSSDVDGKFWIKNIIPGIYTVKFSGVGYPLVTVTGLKVDSATITFLNPMMKTDLTLNSYMIITHEDIRRIPSSMGQQDLINSLVTTPGMTTSGKKNKLRRDPNSSLSGYGISPIQNKTIIFDDDGYTDFVGDEEYSSIDENQFIYANNNPLSTFSVDVDKASYSNIRRMINDGYLPDKDVIRLEEMINYFTYSYPQPVDEHPFSINMETANCPWNTDHQLVMVGLQGKTYEPEKLPASNLVFLVDVSGSMSDANKLPLVKSSLTALVKQLKDEDKIAIVVYAGNAGLVLPSTSGKEKAKILDAIENLSAGGSTAGGAGITLAYDIAEKNFDKNGNNRIILCTDGDFNVGVNSSTDLENLIVSKRDKGIFLTVLGYGIGNYKDSKMEILADKGNGNYAYIDNQLEADKVLVKEMGGTLFTIAKDVKIQIEFNPVNIKSYRLLGYENRVLENWEFNDDTRDAGEIGAGHTVTAFYEIELNETNEKIITDTLKYQSTISKTGFDNELVTVKFRYKPKDKNKSILQEKVLEKSAKKEFNNASENFRFASSVALFGMVLRGSPFKGNSTFDMIIDMAKNAKGFDEDGYRAEFINLVKASKSLNFSNK